MEREALLWLERQAPPSLDVDLEVSEERGRRATIDVFVPVNDVSLVCNEERALRAARDDLEQLSLGENSTQNDRLLTKAKKAVEQADRSLAAALAVPRKEPSHTDRNAADSLLPAGRTKQSRAFPVVVPARARFGFVWSGEPSSQVRTAVDQLCERVTRLGHSSSLVRCIVSLRSIVPNLVPDEQGPLVLRTFGSGQLERLEHAFAHHRGVESRTLPARPQRYGPPVVSANDGRFASGAFSADWILFERVGGARPLSSRGTDLSRALRDALLEENGGKTLPISISGHRHDGQPAERPHVAFVALPFVGHAHADGSVQGCAIVLPREVDSSEREVLLRLIATWEKGRSIDLAGTLELAGGTLSPVRVRRVELSAKSSLRPSTWCRPARRFVTATPIALDRNPGNLRSNVGTTSQKASLEAERSIADSCERIGLPRPVSVEVSTAPLLAGVQPARAFLPWPGRPGRVPRVQVHAEIGFAEPVRGPVLLGAGRYFGLGLCVPVVEETRR